jgi:hypothetical protein
MKLYRVSYSYILEGFQKKFLSKKMKPVSAKVKSDYVYIKSNEINLHHEVYGIIRNKVIEYQNEINSYGYKYIYDWRFEFVPSVKFNKINDFKNVDIEYREATIQECMEQLSPTEYNQIYGNTLKVVKG